MLKNGKCITFLVSHKTKSRIYIRRIEISLRLIQKGGLGFAFVAAVLALGGGIAGVLAGNSAFTRAEITAAARVQGQPMLPKAADYSRPGESSNLAVNSGGPLPADSADSVSDDVESQIRIIEAVSNLAYIPSIWAHAGKINNEFGFRRNPFGGRTYEFHAGMDIDGERGDLVVAPASGVVTEAGWKGGYGNMIEIDHGNGLKTRYGHLSKIEVEVGDTLTRGQLIAFIGSTGRSTGPHLHYELRLNDQPINPRRLLPPEPTELNKIEP